MTATELIRLFHGNPRRNRQVLRCVAHDDRSASLSLRVMNDAVAVKCFSGCTTQEITAAVGLHPRDLYYAQRGQVDPAMRRAREAEERARAKTRESLRRVEGKVRMYETVARYYFREMRMRNRFADEWHTALARARFWNERWNTLMCEIDPNFSKQRVEVQA